MPMHYWGADGWGGWMLLQVAFWLLLLGLLVFGAIALTRRTRSSGEGSSALDVLNERYARGEIDRDEFLQRKKDILER